MTARVRSALGPPRRAFVRGQLHAVRTPDGWYPVLLTGGKNRVWGYLYTTGPDFDRRLLRLLDAYENYLPHHPAASEYVRKTISVRPVPGTTSKAQAYVFMRKLTPAMRRVPGGDFARFLRDTGFAALSSGDEGASRR